MYKTSQHSLKPHQGSRVVGVGKLQQLVIIVRSECMPFISSECQALALNGILHMELCD